MSDWSPPAVRRSWLVGFGVVYLLVLAYSMVIAGQILLGLLIGVAFGLLYLGWRFLAAIEAIADALQRIARHQEADEEYGNPGGSESSERKMLSRDESK